MNLVEFLKSPESYDELAKAHKIYRINDCSCAQESEIEQYFIEPNESLAKHFSKLEIFNTRPIEMIDIYDIILNKSEDNIPLIAQYIVPREHDNDERSMQFKNLHRGKRISAFPWDDGRFGVSYYSIDAQSYTRDDLSVFIDKFRGFEDYHGYIIKKDRTDKFENFMRKKSHSDEEVIEFKEAVLGYFSGIHECDFIVFLLV